MPRRACAIVALTVCCALAAGACGSGNAATTTTAATATTTTTTTVADPVTGELVVLAASSLVEPFEELGRMFEAGHPDVKVTFSFAGSSDLARQIDAGAPADVFASADEKTMAAVVAAGQAAEPVVVARNRLAVIVEKGNPKGVRTLADLARSDVVLVLCAAEVPCGRLAAAAFRKAGVAAEPASLEANVKAVVSKVTLGEADAGIVYRSDVQAARDKVEGVDVVEGADAALQAVYPVALTTAAANRVAAKAWVDLVRSAGGLRALAAAGFLGP